MKVKFMNFKEMAITQNTGMCSYLTIAWAVPCVPNRLPNSALWSRGGQNPIVQFCL